MHQTIFTAQALRDDEPSPKISNVGSTPSRGAIIMYLMNSAIGSTQPALPPDLRLVTFRDALGLAMWLADRHVRLNAIVLIDQNRRPIAVVCTDGDGVLGCPAAANTLLITVGPMNVDVIHEADLARYRRWGWTMAEVGAPLIDWIETDGDEFRSFAYATCPASAWPDDPPPERHEDWFR